MFVHSQLNDLEEAFYTSFDLICVSTGQREDQQEATGVQMHVRFQRPFRSYLCSQSVEREKEL